MLKQNANVLFSTYCESNEAGTKILTGRDKTIQEEKASAETEMQRINTEPANGWPSDVTPSHVDRQHHMQFICAAVRVKQQLINASGSQHCTEIATTHTERRCVQE